MLQSIGSQRVGHDLVTEQWLWIIFSYFFVPFFKDFIFFWCGPLKKILYSSLTMYWTHTLSTGRQSPNHWTTGADHFLYLLLDIASFMLLTPHFVQFSSVQSLSRVRLFATPWITAHQASLSITNSRSLPKLMSIKSVMPSSHLILCCPLLLLPPIPPSIRVFSNESTLRMRWPENWSFSFSIRPSNEHPGLISFRMDWLDLLAVQGTLKSLLQHHSSKASIL